jgi:hypothetical protein
LNDSILKVRESILTITKQDYERSHSKPAVD